MIRPLSPREKWLAIAVGSVVFLFVNFLLIDGFSREKARLQDGLKSRKKQLLLMQNLTTDLTRSEQLDQWLESNQPKLTNADVAGVQLLNEVKALAQKDGVLLEHPEIRQPERQPEYVAVSVEIETKSPWKPLMAFQYALQNPGQFIAVESANLKVDPSDAAQMRGHFKISRWFAPR